MNKDSLFKLYDSKVIPHPLGEVRHGIKHTDSGFCGFGEAYFSSISFGSFKGWKKHLKMTMNIVVPVGSIDFYLHDIENSLNYRINLSASNYKRLTVYPGVWVAFTGKESSNMLLNIASLEHDPLEAINEPMNSFSLDKCISI